MKKQDWLDYFEAVNGRSPELHEVEAARVAGEFVEEVPQQTQPVQEPVQGEVPSSQVEPTPTEQAPTNPQGAVNSQQTYQQQPNIQQPQFVGQQGQVLQDIQGNVPPVQQGFEQQAPIQFQQGTTQQGQQVYNVQVTVPSAFTVFWKQFWTWFMSAIKSPTKEIPTHKYNGVTSYGLLVLFTSLTFTLPLMKSGYLTFSTFFTFLVGIAFINFSIILAGFIVKRVVYKDEKFTLAYSFEWFGRLLTPNVALMAFAALFTLLEVTTLVMILMFASYIIYGAVSAYSLYHAENYSSLDLFYKYIIASILFSIIILIFFILGGTIAGEMLFRNIVNELNNLPLGI